LKAHLLSPKVSSPHYVTLYHAMVVTSHDLS